MELKDLLSDEKFISEIIALDSVEEVQAAFEEKEVELTVEQCEELGAEIKRIITATDNELEPISGGAYGPLFRVGALDEVIEKRNPFKKPSMHPKTISALYTSKRAGNWIKNAKIDRK